MKTPIIPTRFQTIGCAGDDLDLKAIAFFCAAGFFFDTDTYFQRSKVSRPGHRYSDEDDEGSPWFTWHHSPRDISFDEVVEEFADLFESIAKDGIGSSKVILPLSGGLDSRSQAVALRDHTNVSTYSYEFEDSFGETKYGREIADVMEWDFNAYTIPRGYLWNRIEKLAEINGCYAEFTHPRQMSIFDKFPAMGDVFHLGHGGDLFFDNMGVPDNLSAQKQLDLIYKQIVKKGGGELGDALWEAWGLEGDFKKYIHERLETALNAISIDNANSRIRAFKSRYYVPRWSAVNLKIFSNHHDMILPYFDNRMCEFICKVPEKYLSGRQIQIEYIKRRAPELARIPWQTYDPCNLYNYQKFSSSKYVPIRAWRKGKRILREKLLNKQLIQRNWELQFIGDANDQQLRKWLFENEKFNEWIPEDVIREFYDKFKMNDSVFYSHAISMLLTLSLFAHKNL